jgi:hypothetical protein
MAQCYGMPAGPTKLGLRPRFASSGYDEALATMDAEIAGIVKG